MRSAVIVSTARTPIGRAYRGAFNALPAPTLASHSIRAAVERAGLDPAEVDDVILGCALPQGSQAPNIARLAALRAGLPVDAQPRVGAGRRHRDVGFLRRPFGRATAQRNLQRVTQPRRRQSAERFARR